MLLCTLDKAAAICFLHMIFVYYKDYVHARMNVTGFSLYTSLFNSTFNSCCFLSQGSINSTNGRQKMVSSTTGRHRSEYPYVFDSFSIFQVSSAWLT